MNGKCVLITGATDGIGKETAFGLARMGARVLLHGRDKRRGLEVQEEIRRLSGNDEIEFIAADLSSLDEVRKLASAVSDRCRRLQVLLNNAGVYMTARQVTVDGFEMTFAVNHLATFLLSNLLLDLLVSSEPSRIVTVSSMAYQRGRLEFDNLQGEKRFDPYEAYARSKLANVLFTYELAARLRGTGVTANCLHPGVIDTKLLRTGFGGMRGKSVAEGAETSIFLASAAEPGTLSGRYFVKKKAEETSPQTHDLSLRKKLWEVSERLTDIR